MKPTPHFNSSQRHSHNDNHASCDRRNFPLTDYSFQSNAETVARPSAISEKGVSELRTFRKVSSDFLGAEAGRDYIAEVILFVCLSCVAAWPIAIAIHQLTRWMI
jgi:hypothetical protein